MSRRDQIRMTVDEQREMLDEHRTLVLATNGPRGLPHVMPMWFVLRESAHAEELGFPGEPWVWTYRKAQKVKNLERDPRATLLAETGREYTELRGIQVESRAELVTDDELVYEFGIELSKRYVKGFSEVEGAAEALRAQAPKRVAIRFVPERVASWDHSKLGGTY